MIVVHLPLSVSRVPYLTRDELPEDQQYLIESQTVRKGESLRILQAIGNNTPLLEARRAYGAALRENSGLTEQQRELIILTVAFELQSRYIWHQHVRFSINDVLSEAEIRAISEKNDEVFEPMNTALVEYVRNFVTMDVDNEIHEGLSSFFSDEFVVGIGMVAMGYLGLAHGGDAFDVEIEEDEFVGWGLEAV